MIIVSIRLFAHTDGHSSNARNQGAMAEDGYWQGLHRARPDDGVRVGTRNELITSSRKLLFSFFSNSF